MSRLTLKLVRKSDETNSTVQLLGKTAPHKVSQPGAKAATAESAVPAQPAKNKAAAPNADKELKRLDNIQRERERFEKKQRHIAFAQPVLKAYLASQPSLRDRVDVGGVACFRPLALDTGKRIFTFLKSHKEFDDCSNTTLNELINLELEPHTTSPDYLAGLMKHDHRFDLMGNAVEPISEKHKLKALKKCEKAELATSKPPF